MRTARIVGFVLADALVAAFLAPASATVPRADRDAITATALDYAEGWYTGDGDRMRGALHPELAKRRPGDSGIEFMSADQLAGATAGGYGKQTPDDERQADVEILDYFGNVATVKLTMRDWVDYMHIAHVDGEWLIVNVLWDMKPGN